MQNKASLQDHSAFIIHQHQQQRQQTLILSIMPEIILSRQLVRDNNTQAQITPPALLQYLPRVRTSTYVYSTTIIPIRTREILGSLYFCIFSLARFFQDLETHVFGILGFSPATAWRMFPPREQFPEGCAETFVVLMRISSLIALLVTFQSDAALVPPRRHVHGRHRINRRVARHNPLFLYFCSFLSAWLGAANSNVMIFYIWRRIFS
ncbi:hypothetical protein ACQKWADRAFT_58385 [Trichoderma austrokoningii]